MEGEVEGDLHRGPQDVAIVPIHEALHLPDAIQETGPVERGMMIITHQDDSQSQGHQDDGPSQDHQDSPSQGHLLHVMRGTTGRTGGLLVLQGLMTEVHRGLVTRGITGRTRSHLVRGLMVGVHQDLVMGGTTGRTGGHLVQGSMVGVQFHQGLVHPATVHAERFVRCRACNNNPTYPECGVLLEGGLSSTEKPSLIGVEKFNEPMKFEHETSQIIGGNRDA
ncbi:hypothetical protein BVC80_9003g41 [Macleaya cordata]|uniref:Uncharacterized protein n=1 Tax=Macleaya cordata TaxID=56857 RepID=A0A200QLT1_MACCD|nr:hypothetical protein BVC80_9003g41 [Macleaya cordata]